MNTASLPLNAQRILILVLALICGVTFCLADLGFFDRWREAGKPTDLLQPGEQIDRIVGYAINQQVWVVTNYQRDIYLNLSNLARTGDDLSINEKFPVWEQSPYWFNFGRNYPSDCPSYYIPPVFARVVNAYAEYRICGHGEHGQVTIAVDRNGSVWYWIKERRGWIPEYRWFDFLIGGAIGLAAGYLIVWVINKSRVARLSHLERVSA